MQLTNEMLTKYYELVENNCHGELLEEIARDFNLSYIADLFKSINTIHNLEGYLNNDVLEVRNRLKDDLLAAIPHTEFDVISSFI